MKLSVVIPAHNEESGIQNTLNDVLGYLNAQDFDSEVIVVANNCEDNTAQIVRDMLSVHPKLMLIEFTEYHEVGTKGLAIIRGMEIAQGDFHLFMDADNAGRVSEIEKTWKYFDDGYDVVIGSRYLEDSVAPIKQKFIRRVMSRIANLIVQIFLVSGIRDTQCGFKVFTKNASSAIFSKTKTYGWGIDLEVLALAKKLGFRIKEFPLVWNEREKAERNRFNLIKAYLLTFKELLSIIIRLK